MLKRMSLNLSNVTIRLTANSAEVAKIAKFGNPTVNVGGTFDGFVLPNSIKRIPTDFPYLQSFDGNDLGLEVAKARALVYYDEMKIRIRNTMNQFKAIPDNFDDEEVLTV
jgi:hypothetical protein